MPILILLIAMAVPGTASPVWYVLGTPVDELWTIDVSSINRDSHGARVWVRNQNVRKPDGDLSLSRYEVNCADKRLRVVQTIIYAGKAGHSTGEVRQSYQYPPEAAVEVPPGTIGAALVETACSRKKTDSVAKRGASLFVRMRKLVREGRSRKLDDLVAEMLNQGLMLPDDLTLP